MTTEKTNQLSTIVDVLRHITETETVEDIENSFQSKIGFKTRYGLVAIENGVFQGKLVTYKNPLHPDLKTMYHPYIPLQFAKAK